MIKSKFSQAVNQRPVLILDFNNDLQDFETNLIQQNWTPTTTFTLAQSIAVIRQPNIKVAIAIISSSKHQKIFNAVDKLQKIAPKVKWLAVSMQYPITSPAYSQKLSAYFIDYFHRPIDWILFIHSLGHVWGMAKLHKDTNREQLHHIQSHYLT